MRMKPTTSAALFFMFLLVTQTTFFNVTNDVNITMLTSETNGEDSFSVSARNSPSWSTPVSLDSTDEVGEQSSLAIDSNDNLHVTYRDRTYGNLEYMTYNGSSWSTPVSLDSTGAGKGGEGSSLAIDSNDNLHVTYYDLTNADLEYMTYTDTDGDNVPDADDAFPLDPTESVDTDNDGTGDNADTDDDGDNVLDVDDAFPLDSTKSKDTVSDEDSSIPGFTGILATLSLLGAALIRRNE